MNITVIGAGNIGGTIGGKWAESGHEVVFGVRDPRSNRVSSLLSRLGKNASAATLDNSLDKAEVVLFAVPGRVMPDAIAKVGSRLNGKIVIDATNSLGTPSMNRLEILRQTAPDSPLFRAFSTLGWENYANPTISGVQVDLFYCGDNGTAQGTVDGLISDIGLQPVYIGDTGQASIVDGLTQLWLTLTMRQGYRRHTALKLLID